MIRIAKIRRVMAACVPFCSVATCCAVMMMLLSHWSHPCLASSDPYLYKNKSQPAPDAAISSAQQGVLNLSLPDLVYGRPSSVAQVL